VKRISERSVAADGCVALVEHGVSLHCTAMRSADGEEAFYYMWELLLEIAPLAWETWMEHGDESDDARKEFVHGYAYLFVEGGSCFRPPLDIGDEHTAEVGVEGEILSGQRLHRLVEELEAEADDRALCAMNVICSYGSWRTFGGAWE
jgi:hypothetical protein